MEEHEHHHKKKKLKFPKLKKWDKIVIVFAIIFVILMAIPVYRDKGECEIARPGYKCASAQDVMIENCEYWAKYSCDTSSDISLPQVEWYIENLCEIHNDNNKIDFDCSNLRLACNQASGTQLC